MKSISFSYGNVKAVISENALIDTFRFRVPYVSTPRRKFDEYQINNTSVAVNRRRPSQENGWHGYNDIQVSIAKYLFGGNNFCFDFNDYYRREYQKHRADIFGGLQSHIKTNAGIEFDVFRSPSSRLHVALNVQCESVADAEKLRDTWFDSVNLRYLPVKRRHKATGYWNCRSYDGTGKPNQCFCIYPTGNKKLRLEYRRNNITSVRGLFNSRFAESLKLENNFECLSQPQTMNRIFWQTARHFFAADDWQKIVKGFSLRF